MIALAKKKKQAIVKKRTVKDYLGIEGFLKLDNLDSFYVDTEEDGLKNVTSDLKELNGQYVKISISVVNEEDLSSTGFNSSDE